MRQQSLYQVLGLNSGADVMEIKQAYYRLASVYTPENDPERFTIIRQAFEILSNKDTREEYDSIGTYDGVLDGMASEFEDLRFRRDWDGAIEKAYAILEVLPDNLVVKNSLGICYLNNRQFDEARKVFESLVTDGPSVSTYWHNYGQSLKLKAETFSTDESRKEQLLKASRVHFQKSIELCPEVSLSHLAISDTYLAEEKFEEAVDWANKAINADGRVDFDDLDAMFQLCRIYLNSKKLTEIVAMVDRILAILPVDKEYYRYVSARFATIGEQLMENSHFREAISFFKVAVQLKPDNNTFRDLLILAEQSAGEQTEQKPTLEELSSYADAILRLIFLDPTDRVWLSAPVEAKDLVLVLQEKILKAGAFVDIDLHFEEAGFNYLMYSRPENLLVYSPVSRAKVDSCTKTINLWAITDYYFDYQKTPSENRKNQGETSDKHTERLKTVPGVGCHYPTPQMAKAAGMPWEEYRKFFFEAVSVDLKALYDEYRWLEHLVNKGKKIRITSPDTDLTLDITDRPCVADVSYFWNLPDGELFTSPVETRTSGYIKFTNDLKYNDTVLIKDLYLEFKDGRISRFTASEGMDFMEDLLETTEGASCLGEVGIGINPKIDRITNSDVFDEKVIGTIHIALGDGYPETNSQNHSPIHWDLVKDLRHGGKIFIDDIVVFENGNWVKPE